jgi:hypothetical protein
MAQPHKINIPKSTLRSMLLVCCLFVLLSSSSSSRSLTFLVCHNHNVRKRHRQTNVLKKNKKKRRHSLTSRLQCTLTQSHSPGPSVIITNSVLWLIYWLFINDCVHVYPCVYMYICNFIYLVLIFFFSRTTSIHWNRSLVALSSC